MTDNQRETKQSFAFSKNLSQSYQFKERRKMKMFSP